MKPIAILFFLLFCQGGSLAQAAPGRVAGNAIFRTDRYACHAQNAAKS